MASNAYRRYFIQIEDVDSILQFHTTLAGASRGRKSSNLEVLHKSAIVLLTASWEAYIENILMEAASLMARHLSHPSSLPQNLQKGIAKANSKNLAESKDELYVWFFAGDGWRLIVLKFALWKIEEMNTPNAGTVIQLFSLFLGIDDITKSWGRQRLAADRAAEALDEYLDDRHTIAHGKTSSKRYNKSYILGYKNFLAQTIEKTELAVRKMLKEIDLELP